MHGETIKLEEAGALMLEDGPALSPGTVAEVTMQLFRKLGVDRIFGNPGSTELPMFREFPSEMTYVLGLQEAVVVGMADGYAQATRRPSIVNLHSAVGVGHAMGNIFTAYRNKTPMIITAGQQARPLLNMEPFLFSERATELPRPYVKWASEPARAADVPAAMLRAWNIAMQPPFGPVLLSIPVDDWDKPCSTPPVIREASHRVAPDPRLIELVAQALADAEKPLIVAGAGVALDQAWDEVVSLAERHNAPVRMAPMASRCGFPEDHRLFAGFLPARKEGIRAILDGHDLALVLGAPAFTYHADGPGEFVPPGLQLFQLGMSPMEGSWAPAGTAISGNLQLAVGSLLSAAAPERTAPPPRVAAPGYSADRLTDRLVYSRIAALRPQDSIVVEEAPSSRGALHDHLPINDPDGFYTCSSGGLGHSIAAAVGVSLARPGRKLVAVIGDGSAMYSIQSLWSAARNACDIVFVILNNGRYEALREFGEHFQISNLPGVELGGIDFTTLAASFGVKGQRVDNPGELEDALTRAFETPGPTLIEALID